MPAIDAMLVTACGCHKAITVQAPPPPKLQIPLQPSELISFKTLPEHAMRFDWRTFQREYMRSESGEVLIYREVKKELEEPTVILKPDPLLKVDIIRDKGGLWFAIDANTFDDVINLSYITVIAAQEGAEIKQKPERGFMYRLVSGRD